MAGGRSRRHGGSVAWPCGRVRLRAFDACRPVWSRCRQLAVPRVCRANRSHAHMATVTLFVYVYFNNDGKAYCLLVFRRVDLHAMFGFWYTSK